MAEVRILSPCGVIGSGFSGSSFERGLSFRPHVIACDGGSTDMGPASLGTGVAHFSGAITKEVISRLYGIPEEKILPVHRDAAWAIKISIPRRAASADLEDADCYGGQQFGPLVDLDIPEA